MTKSSRSARLRTPLALGAAAAVAIGLAACAPGTTDPETGEAPYKVGVLADLTGSYAALGEPEEKAIRLYFEQLNEAGGIDGHPVELVTADTTSSESEAVNQLRRLAVEENVVAVLGPASSGESIALRTFTAELKVPTISLGSANAIVEPASEAGYIFKQYTSTNESLLAQLEFAKEQGWTKVGILYANNAYGQDPAALLPSVIDEVGGLELTGSEAFDPTATDMTAQLGTLAEGTPDVVLVWAVNPANEIVAKSADQIGFEPVLFNAPGAAGASYIEVGGSAVEGTYLQGSVVLAPESIEESNPQFEITNQLVDAFQEAYGETAGQYAANGWDGSLLLENAIRAAGVPDPSDLQATRDAIRDALENSTSGVVGVNAIYTFTPEFHGSVELGGLAVLQVVDGDFTVVKTY